MQLNFHTCRAVPRQTANLKGGRENNCLSILLCPHILLIIIINLFKKVAMLRESDIHPISPKAQPHNINL